MKIQKAIVNYKGKEQLECIYGIVNNDGNEVSYYFLGEDKTKKFSNGNRIVVDNMTEALDYMYFKEMMPELHSVGLINKKGEVIIPLENKSIKPITDKILLVEITNPVSQSVIEAVGQRKDMEISNLVSTSADIRASMDAKMGPEGRYVFNDRFNEATICNIDGTNLVNGEYYSYVGMANDTLYLSTNVANSEIKEFSLSKGELISADNKSNEVIDVNNVGVDPAVVNDAMASVDVANPPVVDPNVAVAPVVEEAPVAEPTVDAADAPVVEAAPVAEVSAEGMPAVEMPATEEVTAEPTVDAADAPVVEEAPVAEVPAEGMPAVEMPATEEVAAEPTVDAADAPVVEEAPAADAVVEVPEAEVPATEEVAESTEEAPVAETPATEETVDPMAGFDAFFNPNIPADAEEVKEEEQVSNEQEETVNEENNENNVEAPLEPTVDVAPEAAAQENIETPTDTVEENVETTDAVTPPVVDVAAELQNIQVSYEGREDEAAPAVEESAAEEKVEATTEEPAVLAIPDIDNVDEKVVEDPKEEVVEEKGEESVPLIDIFKEEKEKEEAEAAQEVQDVASEQEEVEDEAPAYEFHSAEDTFTGYTDDLDLGLTDNTYLDDDLYSDDSHDEFMDEFNKTMANLVDQSKEQKEEISQLKGRLSTSETQRRNLAEKYKDQTKKLEAIATKAKNLDSMLARSEEKNRQKDEIINDLQRAVKELKRQNKNKRELVNILRDAQQVLNDDDDSYLRRVA